MPPRTGAQRAGDMGKGLAAIFTLVTIVAGVPMGLYRFAGQWMPKTVPTLDQAREALSRPVSDDAMLTGLTLVAWVLWALFTLAVTVEILSWIGHAASPSTRQQSPSSGKAHGRRVRLAVPGLQNAAASLVMAALLVLPTAGAASASTSPASPAPVALQMPDQVATPPTSPGPVPTAAAPAAPQATERVTVKRGDSPWGIAERHLGEGERWRELRHEDGRPLANREIIYAGQVLLVPAAPPPADTPVAAVAAASAETADPATTTVVVRPGDSLWEIAEDKLGDGEQYQGIWAANQGRVMDDGARFRDPDLIRPGWKLSVPGQRYTPPPSATSPPPPVPPAATPATPPPVPPAATPATPPPAPPVVAAATPPAAQDTDTPASTGAPAPADSVAAPPATIWPPPKPPAAPPTTAAAPPTTSQPPATAGPATSPPETAPPPATAEPQPSAAAAKESSGRVAPLPVGLLSGGLAAAAVVGLISRRRHRQIGLRRPGRRPPLPTGEAARAETALRVGADPAGAALLDDALTAVALAVDEDGEGLPEILGAHLTGSRVELLLASPCDDVAEPFEASADGLRWCASAAEVAGFVAARDQPCNPAPTMVTLGATETGTLTINLERIGLLALEGDPQRAAGVLRRMAFELGAPVLAAVVNVVLVGLPEVSGLEDHVQTAGTLSDALDRAASARWWGKDQLAAHGAPSADAARAAGLNGDTWAPSVVLAAGPFTDEDLRRAAEVTADPARTAIAVVMATARAGARWVLDLDDDLVDVGPLGLAVDPHVAGGGTTATAAQVLGYTPAEAEAVSSVLETAARTDDVSPAEPPYDELDEWAWPAPAVDQADLGDGIEEEHEEDEQVGLRVVPDADDPEPRFDVCIDVLGPIQVDGNHYGAKEKPRTKSKEMVVLLALHRTGYTAAQVEAFLWPKRTPAKSTFHTTVSYARAWLRRVEGEDLIPNTAVAGGMSRYRLAPCVGTTWDLFQWRTRNAVGAGAADRLTEALALVRGEPLAGEDMPCALANITEMTCAIGDAAHRLAQLRLEAKDLPRATEAARQGLRGSPWDQRLYGDLMLAAHKGGNPGGVTDVWNELRARLEDEDDDGERIDADVRAIYERCTKRHAR